MRKIVTSIIEIYRLTLSPLLVALFGANVCRFEENCSVYTKRMIMEKGVITGLRLGLIRIAKCQPFYRGDLRKEAI